MRRRRWREESHDFDVSSCSAASSERAPRDRRWRCGDEMHRLKYDRAVRRWDAPTEIGDGGMAMGCASLGRQWWHGEGMRRQKERWWNCEGMRWPKRAMVAWRWDAPAYIGNDGAARGCDGQNGQCWCGEGMRRPNGPTPNRWRPGGKCASQTEQHQIGGGSAGNAPAKQNNTK